MITGVDPLGITHTAPASTDIAATYDQNIDTGGSVTDTTFVVHAMQTGQIVNPPHGNTITVVSDTITFNPDNDFKSGEVIQVSATDGIQNTLAEPSQKRVWTFRAAAAGGTGVFIDSGQELGDHSSQDVAIGDLDGDGDLDAFVANHINDNNRVWINDGSGNFTDSGQELGDYQSYGLALGDLDGDGDLDAFVANRLSHPNRAWINDGSGNFTDSGQSLGSRASHAVALGDLDDDGDLDVFIANRIDNSNRVWLNDGSGNFTDSGQSLGNHRSYDVFLGDLDGDGDLDAFVANYGNQGNRVWLNDGSGNFTDSGQGLGDHYSHGVSLGDLDGDGDLDAFVANAFHPNRIWLNQDPPQVTEVLVRGSGWTQPFLDELGASGVGSDGYSIPVGSADQLDALPWSNIDQILIRFNVQVNVDQSDLTFTGVNVATYSFSGLTTGIGATGDFEAVWTLTAPIATDKLRIRLDGTTGGAVTDTAGNVLDGEWIDTVNTYPSGDHVAGGDFAFRFNVLPADFNGDGVITLNPDLQNMLAGNGASIGAGNYSVFIDLDGNGTVTLNPDLQIALGNNGSSLPAGNPSGAGSAGPGPSSPTGAAAPSTSATAKPNATTVALRRVIALPSRGHAIVRHLYGTTFGRAQGAFRSRPVDGLGTFRARAVSVRGVVDPDEADAEDSVDLLAVVGPIF